MITKKSFFKSYMHPAVTNSSESALLPLPLPETFLATRSLQAAYSCYVDYFLDREDLSSSFFYSLTARWVAAPPATKSQITPLMKDVTRTTPWQVYEVGGRYSCLPVSHSNLVKIMLRLGAAVAPELLFLWEQDRVS